jgi:diguanylate cyclase (GGDEF)-like protein/PAS domain S-box-containing protein
LGLILLQSFSPLMSFRNFTVRLVTGVLLLNVIVIGLAIFVIAEDRKEHDGRARVTAQNLSQLLEQDVHSVFDRVDLTLHTVVDEIEELAAAGPVDQAHLNAFVGHQQSHLSEIISLRVTDAQGWVRYGDGVVSGTRVDLSDRDYFILQRGNPKAGLVIGKPVLARISQQWVVPVSRRVNRPDGEFAGVVYANVPVAYFVKKFSTLNLGSHGVVALRSADHISMARYPELQEGGGLVGQVGISDQLRALLKDNPNSVTYVAPSPADHIERTFSYTRLPDYPLYVVAGLATQDYLDEWLWDSSQTAGVVLVFSLMTVLFTWLVSRSWRRQLATSEALSASEQRWSLALEGGDFAVWDWNIVSGEVKLSQFGQQMFGYSDAEMGNSIGQWGKLCHPDDRERVLTELRACLKGQTPRFFSEFRMHCKDGRWKWIITRGMVQGRSAEGKALRMIGTHTDVTERREREDALQLAATVFEIADEAVIVTDPQNRIISVNPAFSSITGYTPEEAIGQNPGLLSAKTHAKAFYQDLWKTLIETGGWRGEVLNRKKTGELYVEWLSIKRVLDETGRPTHHVAVFSDISQRKEAEARMRHLALHDALTGLPNRTLLTDRLDQTIHKAKREKTSFALLYFDLDKFKPVNDSYGHEVGDLLLKEAATRALDCVRESDTIARIGGDEFVVLLPNLQKTGDAMYLAEKIRHAMVQPFELSGQVFQISASIGMAIYPEHGSEETDLTRHADAALYFAKRNGRNQVALYRPDMQDEGASTPGMPSWGPII